MAGMGRKVLFSNCQYKPLNENFRTELPFGQRKDGDRKPRYR